MQNVIFNNKSLKHTRYTRIQNTFLSTESPKKSKIKITKTNSNPALILHRQTHKTPRGKRCHGLPVVPSAWLWVFPWLCLLLSLYSRLWPSPWIPGMSNDGEEAQIINKQNIGYTYCYYIYIYIVLYHLN